MQKKNQNKKKYTGNYLNAIFVHMVFSTINNTCQTNQHLTEDGAQIQQVKKQEPVRS